MTAEIWMIVAAIFSVLISVYNYMWLKKAYSPKGRWSGLKMKGEAWFFIIVPIFNISAAVNNYFDSPYSK